MVVLSHFYDEHGLTTAIRAGSFAQEGGVTYDLTVPEVRFTHNVLGGIASETHFAMEQWVRMENEKQYRMNGTDQSIWLSRTKVISCSDPALSPLTNSLLSKLWPLSVAERKHEVFSDQRNNEFVRLVRKDRERSLLEVIERVPWSSHESISMFIAGKKNRTVDFAAVTNSFVVDAFGQTVSMFDGRGLETRYCYDAFGRLSSRRNPNGSSVFWEYDTAGNRIRDADELGNETCYAFDAAGREIARWGATHPVARFYDHYGRSIATGTRRSGTRPIGKSDCIDFLSPDSGFDVTRWNYDESTGVMTNIVYADGSAIEFQYDGLGRRSVSRNARGIQSVYQYNSFGELLSIEYSDDTPSIEFRYDGFGRIVSGAVAGVATNGISYSQYGEPIAEVQNGVRLVHLYDEYGRVSGYEIDGREQAGSSVDYTYDETGRLYSISVGTNSFLYSYLPNSHLVAGQDSTFGLTQERVFAQNDNVTVQLSNSLSDQTISRFEYDFDICGRCRWKRSTGLAFAGEKTNEYFYTEKSELASEFVIQFEQTNRISRFEYDEAGNHCLQDGIQGTISFTNNALNQSFRIDTMLMEYDNDGNMIRNGRYEYGWDAENRLKSIAWLDENNGTTNRIAFEYDYQGRIIKKIADGIVSSRIWDQGNVVMECVNEEDTFSVWGLDLEGSLSMCGGVGALLMRNEKNGFVFPLYDAFGNVSEYVSGNGTMLSHHEYDAFGNMLETPASMVSNSRPLFSTKSFDTDVGLSEFQFRFYSPELGRWLNRDPLYAMGIERGRTKSFSGNPLQFLVYDCNHRNIGVSFGFSSGFFGNYYEYCQNNPVNQYDRFGLDDVTPDAPCCDDDSTPRDDETWNSPEHVDSDNCYEYAMNRLGAIGEDGTGGFKHPGDYSGKPEPWVISCSVFKRRAISDGMIEAKSGLNGKCCPTGFHLVYLVFDPHKRDYHWYRKDSPDAAGITYWSHKAGQGEVSDTDGSGNKITDPTKANHHYIYPDCELNYSSPCGFLCAPN